MHQKLSAELKTQFDVIFRLKSLISTQSLRNKITPKIIQDFISVINTELIEREENAFEFMPENREELFYLYKWLF